MWESGHGIAIKKKLKNKVKMLNVGDSFESFQQYFSMFYTISMTPNESYDGIILIKDASQSKIK